MGPPASMGPPTKAWRFAVTVVTSISRKHRSKASSHVMTHNHLTQRLDRGLKIDPLPNKLLLWIIPKVRE